MNSQLLNPRACRSALCLRAAVSKPVREMSCKICEKMLHTLFKAESSSDSLVFANSTYQRLSAFFFLKALSTAELIWTRMMFHYWGDDYNYDDSFGIEVRCNSASGSQLVKFSPTDLAVMPGANAADLFYHFEQIFREQYATPRLNGAQKPKKKSKRH